jgi:hypothetical protein
MPTIQLAIWLALLRPATLRHHDHVPAHLLDGRRSTQRPGRMPRLERGALLPERRLLLQE